MIKYPEKLIKTQSLHMKKNTQEKYIMQIYPTSLKKIEHDEIKKKYFIGYRKWTCKCYPLAQKKNCPSRALLYPMFKLEWSIIHYWNTNEISRYKMINLTLIIFSDFLTKHQSFYSIYTLFWKICNLEKNKCVPIFFLYVHLRNKSIDKYFQIQT